VSYGLWYRMTYCQVKYSGCGTVRHIARLHWSWYAWHCQVKGTGRCAALHIARWNILVVKMCHGTTTSASQLAMCHMVPRPVYFTWQCAMRYHNQCLSPGNVAKCKIAYFYVTNNSLRLNVTLLFFVWFLTTILFNFVSIENKDGHHIKGIC
jgi:hypothetical protein